MEAEEKKENNNGKEEEEKKEEEDATEDKKEDNNQEEEQQQEAKEEQTTHDPQSTLGNFYCFVMDMEALEHADLSIMQLWSVQHVHAWILWTDAQVSSLTKHNKALHLIKVPQWLVDNCLTASGKVVQEGIKWSLKKLH